MSFRFEAANADEANEAVEHFYRFHDDYVAGIEVKFENYKALNDRGESTGIGDACKTIILTVNTRPYGKEHNRLVRVEFRGVKSFKNSWPGGSGPMWGIGTTHIRSDGADVGWEFDFICGDEKLGSAEFSVVCSNIVLTSNYVRKK